MVLHPSPWQYSYVAIVTVGIVLSINRIDYMMSHNLTSHTSFSSVVGSLIGWIIVGGPL